MVDNKPTLESVTNTTWITFPSKEHFLITLRFNSPLNLTGLLKRLHKLQLNREDLQSLRPLPKGLE